MNDGRRHVKRIFWLGMTGAFLLLILYAGCYLLPPFPGLNIDIILNAIFLLAVFLAASAATAVWRNYKKDESPYKVWLFFALGLWTWFMGELVWGVMVLTASVIPHVTAADPFWIAAYGWFSIALYYQYRLIRHPRRSRAVAVMVGAWFLVVLVAHTGAYISNGSNLADGFFEHYLLLYYVACDLAITITSLIFVKAFGTGILMRPWLGLLFMLLADSFYTWLHNFDLYTYSAIGGNLLSLIADIFYLCAFFAIALGCLAQYLLMKYGPGALPFRSVTLLSISKGSRGPRKGESR